MNILIPHSWLLEFLKTEATPRQIAEALSLHSASVESIEKVGKDRVFNIEITTNRVDMASVFGLAREAATALPRLGIAAKLKEQEDKSTIKQRDNKNNYLQVQITNSTLCSRFATILCSAVVRPSPSWLKERLKRVGIRPINNIVDVTNYVMWELGQPMHSFDFDKIQGIKKQGNNEAVKIMILRESREGENITTLDGVTRKLSGGDIVIEDGGKRLIDLCGIMGGENTAIDEDTKKVLLFAQTYDPGRIRRTIQTTNLRTEAATRFEKGTDSEAVLPALSRAFSLLEKTASAKLIGGLIDIYPQPYQPKKILLDPSLVKKYLGVKISPEKISSLLSPLGFKTINQRGIEQASKLLISIPSWRERDIKIPEDLIEEIARIYGYHNLPTRLVIGPPIKKSQDKQFYWRDKAKDVLKYLGFREVYTSSLVSFQLLQKTGFNPEKCLRLKNPLGREGEYLRPSLIPGILEVIEENKGKTTGSKLKIFELSRVYLPWQKKKTKQSLDGDKPVSELLMLSGAVWGADFFKVKGVIESLLEELGIKNYQITPGVDESCPISKLFQPKRRAAITIKQGNKPTRRQAGLFGQIDNNIILFDLDFETLLAFATLAKTYQPLPTFPPIIEDLSFIFARQTYLGPVIEEIKKLSRLIAKVELIDFYKNTRTLRVYYQHPKRTLKDEEIKTLRQKIIEQVETKFSAQLKGFLH